jgi:predicted small lipoprotein YifL
MKYNILTIVIIATLVLTGCGSKGGPDLSPEASSKTVKNVPDWYLDTPKTEGYLYAASNATSQSMQLAVDKARMQAVSELSQMMKSEWSGYTKRVQEEIGTGLDSKLLDTFSQTQENTISNQLENIIVKEKDIQVMNSSGTKIYNVYVLVEFNTNVAQEKLLAQIKADQQLYDAIKASELVDEMEQKVEAYRQRYNNK